jgi:hypothetical protein
MNWVPPQPFAPILALRAVLSIVAFVCSAAALAQLPASPNYRMPLDTVNNGISEMSSSNYKLASSVGDSTFTARLNPQSAALAPGFWHA